jgi:hypothetical protein
MPRTKISEFSSTPASNTDIDSINISEGCAPSGINDAIRELMAQLKDWQSGTSNDPYVVGSSGSLTLNQGTANGVAYLNGSKVVTSGSALTFDGTNYLNVTGLRIGGSDTTNTIYQATGALALSTGSTSPITFNVNVSEVGRFTSTGLGIGTSSPSQKLHVVAAGGYNATFSENSSNKVRLQFYVDGNEAALVSGYDTTAKPMTFYTGGSLRATLDTSGNLGLGVTPSAWGGGSGNKAIEVGFAGSGLWSNAANNTVVTSNAYFNGSGWIYGATGAASIYQQDAGIHVWYNAASGTAGSGVTLAERARITSGGDLLVGTTSASIGNTSGTRLIDSGRTLNITNTSATYPSIITNQVGFGGTTVSFRYTNSEKGYIETSSVAVAYVTTSDYRLKNTIAPMTGALAKLALLKPCTYKWNLDGSDGQGFIAHELAEVCPDAVSGEKDAVDAEGNPRYQGIDTSFLVATLTAAIQEQQAIIESLKARLDAANL